MWAPEPASAPAGGWLRASGRLAEPDVLQVVVPERADEESVHLVRGRPPVGGVVQETEERVVRGELLQLRIERGALRRVRLPLRLVRQLDDRRVVVARV